MIDRPRKVVGVGLACLDQLVVWQDIQSPITRNKVLDYDMQGGGMTGTALVAVTRLGGDAEFWGTVGEDVTGDLILQGLIREGIDVRQVRRLAGQRGPVVLVCVDKATGERHFHSAAWIRDDQPPHEDLSSLEGAGCVLVDCCRMASALRAADEAKRLGVPVVGDIGGLSKNNEALVAKMDYVIASEYLPKGLGVGDDYRRAGQAILAAGAGAAVITLGKGGLVFLRGDEYGQVPAFEVDVVDTTGAGDTFHGAFAYGLVRGLELKQNLLFASAVAAMRCRTLGGRAGIPKIGEVREFLKQRGQVLEVDS